MILLQINNFSVRFAKSKTENFIAVRELNLDINQGEIVGLIGESGSGKSVASQSITRLISTADVTGNVIFQSSSGEVDLLRCNENTLRNVRQRDIAYIFQEPMTALNPLIKCGKQIAESLDVSSEEILNNILIKVELYDVERVRNSYPHELSGGQRQRIMIAMALAKKPKLLIADEPTTALDVAVQNDILLLLKTLCKEENMALLFITHDLLSLANFADTINVMYKGEIVECATTKDILENPKHPYTRALLESRAGYTKRGKKLSEMDDLLIGSGSNLAFKTQKTELLQPSENSKKVILQLTAVSKSHFKTNFLTKQESKVLTNITLDLCQGDILGLIGESGSGKSTIAKMILNIWKPTQGHISLNDTPLQKIENLSNQIQLVFQDPYSSLNPKQRIGNALLEVLQTTTEKHPKEKALSLLQEVGLVSSDFYKYPHEFSGGQRQRICIAKALAKNPKIIVLDEAVSALDVSVQAKILNLLHKLKQEKDLSYLLISHDMNVVSYFCNKMVVLKDGQIVEMGMTEDLITNPTSTYTKTLLESSIN